MKNYDSVTNCLDQTSVKTTTLEFRRELHVYSEEKCISYDMQILRESMIREAVTISGLPNCDISIKWSYLLIGENQTNKEFKIIPALFAISSQAKKIQVILRVQIITPI